MQPSCRSCTPPCPSAAGTPAPRPRRTPSGCRSSRCCCARARPPLWAVRLRRDSSRGRARRPHAQPTDRGLHPAADSAAVDVVCVCARAARPAAQAAQYDGLLRRIRARRRPRLLAVARTRV
eukprot:7261182-Prymnesium_polylepis.1